MRLVVTLSTTVDDLVPGVPVAFWDDAVGLRSTAKVLDEAASRLKRVDTGDWHGQAADAYQGQVGLQRARLVVACDVFGRVADALTAHGEVLAWARGLVRDQLARWRAGGLCQVGQAGISPEQAAAELVIGQTLQEVDASERATVEVLDRACQVGPGTGSIWSVVTGSSDNPWQQDGALLGAGLQQAALIFASDGEAAGGIKSAGFATLSARQVERFTALAERSSTLEHLRPMFMGSAFNWERYASYDAMEVRLLDLRDEGVSTYRLDSYTPGELVVSRKHTQLADVDPAVAISYLREMTVKYAPGRSDLVVANTPMN